MKTKQEILNDATKFIEKRTLLNVSYDEKDAAKELGAKWNPDLKKWYVENFEGLNGYLRYDNDNQTTNNFADRVKFFLQDQQIEIRDWQQFVIEAFTRDEQERLLANIKNDKNIYLCKDLQTLSQIVDKMLNYLGA